MDPAQTVVRTKYSALREEVRQLRESLERARAIPTRRNVDHARNALDEAAKLAQAAGMMGRSNETIKGMHQLIGLAMRTLDANERTR